MRLIPGQPLFQGDDEKLDDIESAPAEACAAEGTPGAANGTEGNEGEAVQDEDEDEDEEKDEPLPPGSIRHSLTTLKDGPIYRLRVAAYNQRGKSAYSQVSESFECLSKMQWMQMKREAEMAALAGRK